MIAAEQFRRRLMANRADIDCGYYTLTWQAMDWGESAYVQVINSDYIGNIISIEVNGITVPINYVVLTQNADMTVKVRLRNLYSCASLMRDLGYTFSSSMVADTYIIRPPYNVDVSQLDTSITLNMAGMLANIYAIGGITGLASLDTSNVTNMSGMFSSSSGYNAAELAGWDTSKVTAMRYMFSADFGIGTLLPTSFDLSSWDTRSVETMEMMFLGQLKALSIKVDGWNTSKVKNMGGMFAACTELQALDLGSFNFTAIEEYYFDTSGQDGYVVPGSMYSMFADCSALQEVTIRGAISPNANTDYMFSGARRTGILKYNPAHLADYQAKIFPRLPSGWTTQAL